MDRAGVAKTEGPNLGYVKQLLGNRMLMGVYIAQYCINALTYFFITWFPVYLVQARGMSILKAGFVASIPAVCGFLGGIISDALLRRGASLSVARKVPIVLGMPAGKLYRFDANARRMEAVIDDLIVPNGLAFSPDGRTMYLSDSHASRQTVWAFDYDIDSGTPHNRRIFIDMHAHPGRPDGAAVDADGCHWICGNDAGLVHRFTPDGRLDRSVAIPTPKPAMCAVLHRRLCAPDAVGRALHTHLRSVRQARGRDRCGSDRHVRLAGRHAVLAGRGHAGHHHWLQPAVCGAGRVRHPGGHRGMDAVAR